MPGLPIRRTTTMIANGENELLFIGVKQFQYLDVVLRLLLGPAPLPSLYWPALNVPNHHTCL